MAKGLCGRELQPETVRFVHDAEQFDGRVAIGQPSTDLRLNICMGPQAKDDASDQLRWDIQVTGAPRQHDAPFAFRTPHG